MAMPLHLHTVCGCFCATATELIGCHRDCVACKAENISSGPLQNKFAKPCCRRIGKLNSCPPGSFVLQKETYLGIVYRKLDHEACWRKDI